MELFFFFFLFPSLERPRQYFMQVVLHPEMGEMAKKMIFRSTALCCCPFCLYRRQLWVPSSRVQPPEMHLYLYLQASPECGARSHAAGLQLRSEHVLLPAKRRLLVAERWKMPEREGWDAEGDGSLLCSVS